MQFKTKILVWCFAVVFIYQQWSYASIDSSLRNVINNGTSLTNVQPLTGDMRNSGNGLTMMQQVPGDIRGGVSVTAVAASTNYVAQSVSSNGLYFYFKFDELHSGSRTNSFDNNVILTAVNSPTGSVNGLVSNCVQLKNSTIKYLQCTNDVNFSFNSVTSMCLATRVYIGSTTVTSGVITKYTGGGNREWALEAINNNPMNLMFTGINSNGAIKTCSINLSATAGISNWYLVILRLQTNAISIQTNMGVRVSTALLLPFQTNSACVPQFGAEAGGIGFEGRMDETFLWRNYLPTDAEIGALYSNGVNGVATSLIP